MSNLRCGGGGSGNPLFALHLSDPPGSPQKLPLTRPLIHTAAIHLLITKKGANYEDFDLHIKGYKKNSFTLKVEYERELK